MTAAPAMTIPVVDTAEAVIFEPDRSFEPDRPGNLDVPAATVTEAEPDALLDHSLAGFAIAGILAAVGCIATVLIVGSLGSGLALAALLGGTAAVLVAAL